MSHLPFKTWDIFCRVVDNYGDIGVCWRLARQLAHEYPFQVRLWVDEIAALSQIWPNVTAATQQFINGVDVRIWPESLAGIEPADVVVEAFACELPENYLAAMKHRPTPSHWFNLEYLSAEDWVEGCHGLFSMHPQLGLKKAFFFPGFSLKTGGLLKEGALQIERDSFQTDATNKASFFQDIGIEPHKNELIISLFGYENSAIGSLLDAWINSPIPILCLVPNSKILPDINRYLGESLISGDELIRGALRIKVIPFLSQTGYDRLLWVCDLNFVRGEDSFVRAQWAGSPLVWHIYPQEDDIHLVKLDAFLNSYLTNADPRLQIAIRTLWHDWNSGENCSQSWNDATAELQNWQKHSRNWCQHLNSLGDLASNMVQFCQKTL